METLCTTNDPADSLAHHQALAASGFEIGVLPTFRADQALVIDDAPSYNAYLDRLGAVAGVDFRTLADLEAALRHRHDFFARVGCRLSDHGLEHLHAADYTVAEAAAAFAKIRGGSPLTSIENHQLKSTVLVLLAELDWEKG